MAKNTSNKLDFGEFSYTQSRNSFSTWHTIKSVCYWLFVLFSIAVFTVGVLAFTGLLPNSVRDLSPVELPSPIDVRPDKPNIPDVTAPPPVTTPPLTDKPKAEMSTQPVFEVDNLQFMLLELGYAPGAADGKMGQKTRQALQQFSRDYGLEQANMADAELYKELQQYMPKNTRLPAGYSGLKVKIRYTVDVPNNAKLSESLDSWECLRGFIKSGDRCVTLKLPAKGVLNDKGNDWTCQTGYKKKGNRCMQIYVPANAFLNFTGDDWECRRGYKRDRYRCIAIAIPQNASLNSKGDGWVCNDGYTQQKNICTKR
ncbi:peptidoglycan-binding domain-containing protein [Vibrio sp. SCSIO 43136]|uniref:peptidoglycan-binding domain-containing protein n=1 Tax=Vibrio sp. SCSIO 43136 TaxID=2819101 RepID=UPI00207523D9|nr:peptidoglycan-binding domain-containing protein [Vibrio sp. SCSIO 43136]USD65593.1 peptidoglycan-binding protein [Vibrio sp. SCSIO 43136]